MMDGTAGDIRYPFADPPGEGEAVEVAQGILWMRLPLPMALDHVNIFALDDGARGWTIVDTGMMTGRTKAIWARLLAGPLGGRPVWRVIVTHYHPDHIGRAGWFQAEKGAELWTTRTSWLLARMLVLDVEEVASAQAKAFWRSGGMDAAVYDKRASGRPFNFSDIVAPLPVGYRRIVEGERVEIGGRDWVVHIGHGHAPEQATFWDEAGDLVLGADQLLPSISPNLGVHATEPEADPVADWLESCDRLMSFATDRQLVLPGHKLPFTGLPFRLRQKIDNHHGALARLRAHLAEPRTAAECFIALFRREIQGGEYGLALAEAVGHLNHLLALGEVVRERRADGAWLWRLA
jgi:glyoxylase-like metal-dependent hydrolase (beta-lactamase superfamily II)